MGNKGTRALLELAYYLSQIREGIEGYMRTCLICQQEKVENKVPSGLLEPLPVAERLWNSVMMDFIMTLLLSDSIMVVVDRFSKFATFNPGSLDCKTEEAAPFFLKNMVNRVNAILESYLRHFVSANQWDWSRLLDVEQFSYNLQRSEATGRTPFKLEMGQEPHNIHTLFAFNADFDGDQMVVHVPLCLEAQVEDHLLMFSHMNLLSPTIGDPISVPAQAMLIGLYVFSSKNHRGVHLGFVNYVMAGLLESALLQLVVFKSEITIISHMTSVPIEFFRHQRSSYEEAVLCWNLSYEMSGVMRNAGTSLYLWNQLLLYQPVIFLVPDPLKSTLSKGDLDEPILGLNGFGWHRSKSGGQRRWISGTGGIGQALSVPRLILEMSREVVKRTEPFIRLLQYGTKSLMPSRVLFH
ncbi:hypothetical protein FXO38_18232 [Capsicum annuum]|nr:hypothetical protein FXO38_18232 [Capsicum annuum]